MGYRVPWLDEISTDAPFALDCYRKAVNAIPDHELALNNLVYLLELCGKGKECEMYLERLPQHRVAQIRRHFKAHKLNIESEAE